MRYLSRMASGWHISFRSFMNLYKSKRWEKKRKVIFKRDDYLCAECRRYGAHTPAHTVHHIFTSERHPEHMFTSSNLISLCNKCHEGMHNRATGELSDKGKWWQERVRAGVFK